MYTYTFSKERLIDISHYWFFLDVHLIAVGGAFREIAANTLIWSFLRSVSSHLFHIRLVFSHSLGTFTSTYFHAYFGALVLPTGCKINYEHLWGEIIKFNSACEAFLLITLVYWCLKIWTTFLKLKSVLLYSKRKT